jgi:hypothetical protein
MLSLAIASFLFFWSMLIAWFMGKKDHIVDVHITHMNRITASIIQHNDAAIQEFLAKTGKANFVLPNCCIIVAVRHGNVRRLFMLDNKPTDAKRFVSSVEFNKLELTVPDSKGSNVSVFCRHGQALHNLTPGELQKVWDDMPEESKSQYITRTIERIGIERWSSKSPERRMILILQELRYDAPLTEKGREEARQASEQLRTYLQENHPHAHVRVVTSELLRTYETAALILDTWKTMDTSFSFDTTVQASKPFLNEVHREIGSAVHMLGTDGRLIAEALGLHWKVYAQYILKNPLSEEAIPAMSDEEQQVVKDKVVHITSENIPMPLKKRPSSLHGVPVSHEPCPKPRKREYDLFTVSQH